jgi:hypothetical protein
MQSQVWGCQPITMDKVRISGSSWATAAISLVMPMTGEGLFDRGMAGMRKAMSP